MDSRLAEARDLLRNLLLSPYHESSAWDITRACVYFEHEIMRPSGKCCICGHVKGKPLANVTETI